MVDKVCTKCSVEKPCTEYYRHPLKADGYQGHCKACHKASITANRAKNVESVRAYDRERGNRQSLEYQHRYRDENPKKRAAHVLVGNAIRDKRLVPEPCEVCGTSKVHGHHSDYDQPLTVMWLCAEHHKAWHTQHGEGLNA